MPQHGRKKREHSHYHPYAPHAGSKCRPSYGQPTAGLNKRAAKKLLTEALMTTFGDIAAAARILGCSRRWLNYLVDIYDLYAQVLEYRELRPSKRKAAKWAALQANVKTKNRLSPTTGEVITKTKVVSDQTPASFIERARAALRGG